MISKISISGSDSRSCVEDFYKSILYYWDNFSTSALKAMIKDNKTEEFSFNVSKRERWDIYGDFEPFCKSNNLNTLLKHPLNYSCILSYTWSKFYFFLLIDNI